MHLAIRLQFGVIRPVPLDAIAARWKHDTQRALQLAGRGHQQLDAPVAAPHEPTALGVAAPSIDWEHFHPLAPALTLRCRAAGRRGGRGWGRRKDGLARVGAGDQRSTPRLAHARQEPRHPGKRVWVRVRRDARAGQRAGQVDGPLQNPDRLFPPCYPSAVRGRGRNQPLRSARVTSSPPCSHLRPSASTRSVQRNPCSSSPFRALGRLRSMDSWLYDFAHPYIHQ